MIKKYTAKPISQEKYILGESPFYQEQGDIYSWVDIVRGIFYKKEADTITSIEFGEMIGAAVPAADGSWMIAGQKAIYKLTAAGKTETCVSLEDVYDRNHRSNDAKLDPQGRLFFGSIALQGEASGSLYCYDGSEVRVLEPETKLANGMAWSTDQKTFYFSDSEEKTVYRFDYDAETVAISNRTVLFEIENGVPDGMIIDHKNNLWVAVWGGRRVEYRDGKSGALLGIVEVPAEQVSSCCLCGEDELFITTAGEGLDGALEGCLFRAKIRD